jgi:hypothetical protein
MRLVVEIQAVADQLFELDFRWAFGASTIVAATIASIASAFPAGTVATWPVTARAVAAWRTPVGRPLWSAALAWGTVFLPLLLLLCHF